MFTDEELAQEMLRLLIAEGVMTAEQQAALLEDPTEMNVGTVLGDQPDERFGPYWAALGDWLAQHGGDIARTSGSRRQPVPGRQGGALAGTLVVVYNDAFRDTRVHLDDDDFNAVKAVSNQLRFAREIQRLTAGDDDSDSSEGDGGGPAGDGDGDDEYDGGDDAGGGGEYEGGGDAGGGPPDAGGDGPGEGGAPGGEPARGEGGR